MEKELEVVNWMGGVVAKVFILTEAYTKDKYLFPLLYYTSFWMQPKYLD